MKLFGQAQATEKTKQKANKGGKIISNQHKQAISTIHILKKTLQDTAEFTSRDKRKVIILSKGELIRKHQGRPHRALITD